MGKSKPRYQEFLSLMFVIEVIINNRPLAYLEDDIQSAILTPNVTMFDYPVEIPHLENPNEDLEVTIDLKQRYRGLRNAREKIWERWRNEYLKYLRERHNLRHKEKGSNPTKGDTVIVKGEERNRTH